MKGRVEGKKRLILLSIHLSLKAIHVVIKIIDVAFDIICVNNPENAIPKHVLKQLFAILRVDNICFLEAF